MANSIKRWKKVFRCDLVRLDSGHDAFDKRIVLYEEELADFIIKWNPRKSDLREASRETGC